MLAEVHESAHFGERAAVQDLVVAPDEATRGEGVEHELRRDAQHVERLRALVRIPGAVRADALGQEPLLRAGILLGIRRTFGEQLRRLRAREVPARGRLQAVADVGVRVLLEPVGGLHDVAVGVEVHASGGIWHLWASSCFVRERKLR